MNKEWRSNRVLPLFHFPFRTKHKTLRLNFRFCEWRRIHPILSAATMPPKSAKSKEAPVERPILGRFSSHLKIGIVYFLSRYLFSIAQIFNFHTIISNPFSIAKMGTSFFIFIPCMIDYYFLCTLTELQILSCWFSEIVISFCLKMILELFGLVYLRLYSGIITCEIVSNSLWKYLTEMAYNMSISCF
jgi:hypothetical protein